jgi:hypothetical protein
MAPAEVFTAFPNPTAGLTTVRFGSVLGGDVSVELFDLAGVRLRTLFEGSLEESEVRELTLDGGNLPSGVYQCRLTTATGSQTLKIVVVGN